MQESNSSSKYISAYSDSEESEISAIPQLQKPSDSFSEEKYKSSGEYIKVSNKNEKIDEEAILQEFNKKQCEQQNPLKKIVKVVKKIKIQKVPATPSKKYDLGNIKKKWKGQIDQNIAKYKQYLNQQKKSYDGKQKEYLLEFYKVLLDGIYELKYHNEDPHNDLKTNELKIIDPESDIHLYLKDIVEKFDRAFREAKINNKISNIKFKWDPLIKNCRDQSNYELRRKIIRAKVKPSNVLENSDQFLMSEEAKLREQKRRQLILNEAAKNFEKPLEGSEEHQQIQLEQNPQLNVLPEPIQSIRSVSSNDYLERKLNLEKQKLEEYKQSVGDQPALMMKKRIIQLLAGTSSYDRIMTDFKSKFGNV